MIFFFVLANERVAYDFMKGSDTPLLFNPDGLTIDDEGFLYSALNNGSAVWKIDPR